MPAGPHLNFEPTSLALSKLIKKFLCNVHLLATELYMSLRYIYTQKQGPAGQELMRIGLKNKIVVIIIQ